MLLPLCKLGKSLEIAFARAVFSSANGYLEAISTTETINLRKYISSNTNSIPFDIEQEVPTITYKCK
jgi:hypothetical protein